MGFFYWLAEGGPMVIVGLCAIVSGGVLLLLWKATDPDDYDGTRRRPREMQPWGIEPTGEKPHVANHRFAGTPGEETRVLRPITSAGRARVEWIGGDSAREPIELDHAGAPGRVRETQEEDVQEEGSEDRERRQDEGGAIGNGEEGSEDTEAPRALTWHYAFQMDLFYLTDPNGLTVAEVTATDVWYDPDKVGRSLIVQGLPSLPPDLVRAAVYRG